MSDPAVDESAVAQDPAPVPVVLPEADPEPFVAPPMRPYVVLDVDGLVISAGHANAEQVDGAWVDEAVALDARARIGRCKLIDGALVDIVPPVADIPVPVAVSKLGLVRALIATDQWNAVSNAINADALAAAQWNAASQIALADPLTQQIIGKLGLSDEQVAALMRAAVAASAT